MIEARKRTFRYVVTRRKAHRHVPTPRRRPLSSKCMGVLKSLFRSLLKLAFLTVVTGVIAGVAKKLKRPKETEPVSFEQWPDVPQNPASE